MDTECSCIISRDTLMQVHKTGLCVLSSSALSIQVINSCQFMLTPAWTRAVLCNYIVDQEAESMNVTVSSGLRQ